jgi:KUP system potassium uptake protein
MRDGTIVADRVAGTAVFLNRGKQTTPLALRANVETNHVRHEHVVIMSVETELRPRVPDTDRIEVDDLGFANDGITHITARYGYTETPDVPAALRLLRPEQTEGEIDPDAANYFLSKIELRAGDQPTLARWRKGLFIATSHITADAADEFGLPTDRTLIVGSHIDV